MPLPDRPPLSSVFARKGEALPATGRPPSLGATPFSSPRLAGKGGARRSDHPLSSPLSFLIERGRATASSLAYGDPSATTAGVATAVEGSGQTVGTSVPSAVAGQRLRRHPLTVRLAVADFARFRAIASDQGMTYQDVLEAAVRRLLAAAPSA